MNRARRGSGVEFNKMKKEVVAALTPVFDELVKRLRAQEPCDDISKIPKQTGLYALSENGTYRYVGIAEKSLHGRVKDQVVRGSALAKKIAFEALLQSGRALPRGKTAKVASGDYQAARKNALKRIAAMDVRFLIWDSGYGDYQDLLVFEIYAAAALEARYYDRLDKDPRPAGSIRKPAG
jgi:hypothetical protein